MCTRYAILCGLLAVGLAGAAFRESVARHSAEKPAEDKGDDAVPSGVWKLEVDYTVDGELKGQTNTQPMRLVVIRNRVSGQPADDEPDRARLSGEVVTGKSTIVTWRQDNSNIEGYSQFSTGRVTEKGKIVGTWHDTEGQSGDFVLTFEKK